MLASWVRETVSAGGTGNLTLSGAVDSSYISCNTAFGVDAFFQYTIADGSNREIGRGHLSASTTLVRDKVLVTLVSGTYDATDPSPINVTTAAHVFVAPTHISEQLAAGGLPRRAVLLGASFLALGISNSGETYANTNGAWWCWMQALLGHPFQVVCNAAVSGYTAEQIRTSMARIEKYMPCTVFLDGGHNNIMIASQGDVAQAVPVMSEVMDYLKARGNHVIFVPSGPLAASYAGGEGYSAANAKQLLQLHEWIGRKCADLGFIFIDPNEVMLDAASSGGVVLSGMTSDGWHTNAAGGFTVGNHVAQRIAGLVGSRYQLVVSQLDDVNVTDGNALQVIANPMHTTTTGGILGTGATGTVAGSRICQRLGGAATGVCSVVARNDDFGSDQRTVITSTAANDAWQFLTFDFSANLSNSDVIEVACDISAASMTALKQIYLYVTFTVGGTAYHLYDFYPLVDGWINTGSLVNFMLKTQRFQIPASGSITAASASVIATFSASGGATIDVGRWTCRRIQDHAPANLLENFTS